MAGKATALKKTPGGASPELVSVKQDLPQLDRLIHERLRLGIISALAATESMTFVELKKLLETTDGNLSIHARKLEEAGYILCTKGYEGRVPRSDYRITLEGRKALGRYLDHMESLVKALKQRG